MSSNGSEPSRIDLQPVIEMLETYRRVKQQEVAELETELKTRREELRRVERMLSVQQPPAPKKRPAIHRPSGATGSALEQKRRRNEEALRVIRTFRDGVVEDVPGSFTYQTLADAAGMSKGRATDAVMDLRQQGIVRLVGERKLGPGRTSMIYALIDEEVS